MSKTIPPTNELTESQECGWVKLYLKGQPGVLVTLPVFGDSAEEMAACVQNYLNFFQADNPALEPGLLFSEIVGAVRRQHDNDGKLIDVVDLYVDQKITKFKTQSVYMDPSLPQRQAAFELVSGLKVSQMPMWEGEASPTWDAKPQVLQKYMRAPVSPFKLVQKPNPKYDPNTEEGKKKSSRLLVGFLHNGQVIGGYDDDANPVEDRQPTKAEPAKQAGPKLVEKTGGADNERRFLCNRIDVGDRRDTKGKVIRFYAHFDEPGNASAIAFSREVLKKAIGEANDDFYFLNVPGQPWLDALTQNGSYYPSNVIDIMAERHTGEDKEGKSFTYWQVVKTILTDEPNFLPGEGPETEF